MLSIYAKCHLLCLVLRNFFKINKNKTKGGFAPKNQRKIETIYNKKQSRKKLKELNVHLLKTIENLHLWPKNPLY